MTQCGEKKKSIQGAPLPDLKVLVTHHFWQGVRGTQFPDKKLKYYNSRMKKLKLYLDL
jgi:hypothetical protein